MLREVIESKISEILKPHNVSPYAKRIMREDLSDYERRAQSAIYLVIQFEWGIQRFQDLLPRIPDRVEFSKFMISIDYDLDQQQKGQIFPLLDSLYHSEVSTMS